MYHITKGNKGGFFLREMMQKLKLGQILLRHSSTITLPEEGSYYFGDDHKDRRNRLGQSVFLQNIGEKKETTYSLKQCTAVRFLHNK